MKNKKWLHIIICTVLIVMPFHINALANSAIDTNQIAKLNIVCNYEGDSLENVKFDLYKVAEVDAYGEFTLTEDFSGYGISLEQEDSEKWRALAETLAQYVQRDNIPYLKQKVTDSKGDATFDDLSVGMYLVYGHCYTDGDFTYVPETFLVSLPNLNEKSEWIYNVKASCKGEGYFSPPKTSTIKVLKVWDDKGHETVRPKEIEVQLLCNGSIYETITLNSGNNWRHTWKNLSTENRWGVIEKTVPENYSVLVSKEGKTFVVTNTYTPDFTSVEVLKLWKDAGYEKKRPAMIEVQLICDNSVYETITLNADNNWQYVWKELESGQDWTVKEKTIPNGYTNKVEQKGNKFTVINTYTPHATPDQPKLPQTGQLWWPVPVLICLGLVFCILGFLLEKKQKINDKK